jgi:hypothetical protein
MLPPVSLSDMLNGSDDRVEMLMSLTTLKGDAERVYRDWDDALGRKDVEAAIDCMRRIACSNRRLSAIC